MVTISALKRRGILEEIYDDAVAKALTLIEGLKAFRTGIYPAINGGRTVVSHSGSGQSTSFEIPSSARGFTQDEMFALGQLLVEVYRSAVTTIGGSPDDATIFAAMLEYDQMVAVTRVYNDWTGLNWGYG